MLGSQFVLGSAISAHRREEGAEHSGSRITVQGLLCSQEWRKVTAPCLALPLLGHARDLKPVLKAWGRVETVVEK